MQIFRTISAALVLTGLALSFSATAQDVAAPSQIQAPPSDLALGEEVVGAVAVGSTYTRHEYGNWEMRCVVDAQGKDPCQLYQLMKNSDGNPVAEISLFELPPDQPAVAGATIATPLETLLTQQLTVSVDGRNGKRYPFSYCSLNGCYARIGLTSDDIADFKRGVNATVSIVPVTAPQQPVQLTLSLTGFTSGYAAVIASNAANLEE